MPTKRLTEAGVGRERPAAKGKRKEIFDKQTAGLVLRVTDKGVKSWSVYYYDPEGKHRRHTLGRYPDTGLVAARNAAAEAKRAAKEGLPPDYFEQQRQQERRRERLNTFGTVAEQFMSEAAAELRTKDNMQRQLNRDILPLWRNRPIQDITRTDVRELLARRKGKHARNKTLALVRRIFNWAIDEAELIDTTPISRNIAVKVAERERVLTDSEIARIWGALDRLGQPYGALFRMLFLTGTRRSEVSEMTWQEVDGDKWRVPGKRVKSGKGTLIHLTPLSLKTLYGVSRIACAELVFTVNGGTPISGWSQIKKRLDRIIAKEAAHEAGEVLDMKKHAIQNWRFHDIRRTFATGLRSLGFDRLLVSQCLGHAEGGITRIYDRFVDDEQRAKAYTAWSGHIERITGNRPADNVVPLHAS